jgi:WD40 repeat protein
VHIFSASSLNTPIASINSGILSALAFSLGGDQYLALAAASPIWQHGGLAVYLPLPPTSATTACGATNTGPYYTNNFSCQGELSVAWSRDGAFIMGGSTTGNALIHYISSEQLYELDNPAEVVAVSWRPVQENLPDGANPKGRFFLLGYMATADTAGVVRVWGNDKKSLVAMRAQQPIRCLAWSPDGNFLAAGSADGIVQVWQAHLSDLMPAWQNVKD